MDRDPDGALRLVRLHIAEARRARTHEEAELEYGQAALAFDALDEYLGRDGGYLPDDWSEASKREES